MINSIISGIANALDQFNYPIYDDKVPQGFESPSFLIKHLLSPFKSGLSNTSENRHNFIIQYYGKDKADMNSMLMKLNEALEYIQVGDRLYNTNDRQGEAQDEMLNFTFNVVMFAGKVEEEVAMEKIKEGITVR